MKEITISKNYVVFENEHDGEVQMHFDEDAFFGDTIEELKEAIESNSPEPFSHIELSSSGIAYSDYSSSYKLVAFPKFEVATNEG